MMNESETEIHEDMQELHVFFSFQIQSRVLCDSFFLVMLTIIVAPQDSNIKGMIKCRPSQWVAMLAPFDFDNHVEFIGKRIITMESKSFLICDY